MSLKNTSHSVVDDYYDNVRPSLVALLPSKPTAVLDIGCGRGAYLRVCAQREAQLLCGVELRPDIVDSLRAESWIDTVLTGSIDDVDLLPFHGRFDLVIASFVLEHVANPWKVLARLRPCLRAGGRLVGSLPNVRHLPVSTRLLFAGRWEYASHGVMDWTHLRYFTRHSIEQLLRECGFAVQQLSPEFGARARTADRWTLGLGRDLLAYGYNFAAEKVQGESFDQIDGPSRLVDIAG